MKDRVTMLPDPTHVPLQAHLAGVKQRHEADVAQGLGAVYLMVYTHILQRGGKAVCRPLYPR